MKGPMNQNINTHCLFLSEFELDQNNNTTIQNSDATHSTCTRTCDGSKPDSHTLIGTK